jgi:glycosyltransferase involved in cell wall biosynthesis
MPPKVTLILTIHNRKLRTKIAPFLAQVIASVQAQTYPNYELILWDDGSTDDSGEIAAHHAAQDPRIRYFRAKHQSRNASLRTADQQARGQYIGRIDSDESSAPRVRLTPATLAATVSFLNTEPDIGMVYTDHHIIDTQGNSQGYGHRCQIPYSKD